MDVICYACGRGENPENTLQGIAHCQSLAPDWRIEMDIQMAGDGTLVLFHDEGTLRITGEDANISELTLSEISHLNAGHHFNNQLSNQGHFPHRDDKLAIPTLEQVFELFPNARLMLDIHTDNLAAVAKVIAMVEAHSAQEQVVIASHHDHVIRQFREVRPDWIYGASAREVKKLLYSSFLRLEKLCPIPADILMVPRQYGKLNVLSKRILKRTKDSETALWAWLYEGECVRNIDCLEDYLALEALGVDGVFSDRPQNLLAELCNKP